MNHPTLALWAMSCAYLIAAASLPGCCLFKELSPQEVEAMKRATEVCKDSPGEATCRVCCKKEGRTGGTFINPNPPPSERRGPKKPTKCSCH
ncbi:MAG: hypothetical protein HY898_35710 [Deltaproteobacteria bacterium]|nr:hypothetical protein [Deltaproteobacteria bacterium]